MLIFENATLIDGTGSPAQRAEVAIEGERISAIADIFPAEFKARSACIDLHGRVLAPGFVDIHAHGELEPLADNSAAGKVACGVTTEISGNCGHSPFPLLGPLRERFEREARDEWKWPASALNWTTAAEYFDVLDRKRSAINRGFLLGHGSLRAAVNGYDDKPIDCEGQNAMRRHVEASLDAGCFGLSTGLVYPPGCFAPRDEVIDLAKICARKNALYTSHMRSESDDLEAAIDETLDVARATGARTQISHLKTAHQRNWHKIAFL